MAQYPDIELQIGEDDRVVDLVQEGVDCVLRAGILRDSSMVGRRIASMQQITCASPEYLAKYGEPVDLDALTAHRVVNYISSATGKAAALEFMVNGQLVVVQLKATVSVTGANLYTGAAVAGMRLVQVPRYRVFDEIKEGRLKVVLANFIPPPIPISILYPQSRQLSSRVRVFVQWMSQIFSSAG